MKFFGTLLNLLLASTASGFLKLLKQCFSIVEISVAAIKELELKIKVKISVLEKK